MFDTFNVSITREKYKDQIPRQEEIVFLFKLIFGHGKVNMIHHFQEIGRNWWTDTENSGAIQGIQKTGRN